MSRPAVPAGTFSPGVGGKGRGLFFVTFEPACVSAFLLSPPLASVPHQCFISDCFSASWSRKRPNTPFTPDEEKVRSCLSWAETPARCLEERWESFWCLYCSTGDGEVGLYSSPEAASAVMAIRACSGDCWCLSWLLCPNPSSGHGPAKGPVFHAGLVVRCSSSRSLGFSIGEVLCSFQAWPCFHQTQGHLFGRSTGGECLPEKAQARHMPKLARRLMGHGSVLRAVSSAGAWTQLVCLMALASSSLLRARLGALAQLQWLLDLPKPG